MWIGTMFVDLDWPLNASSPLSASADLVILCFAFTPIVTFTALRQWLVPAVADEPTTHVVPFLYPLCKLFYELASCTYNKINK